MLVEGKGMVERLIMISSLVGDTCLLAQLMMFRAFAISGFTRYLESHGICSLYQEFSENLLVMEKL